MQACGSVVIFGYFCIGFIDFTLKGKGTNMYSNLIDQQQFRLNKINETNDYFIVLSATSGGISILLFATVTLALVRITNVRSFFFNNYRNLKKILKTT